MDYTIEQLSKLSDEELNRLAGERVMKYTLCEETQWWFNPTFSPHAEDYLVCRGWEWTPCTDRNQSDLLLQALLPYRWWFDVKYDSFCNSSEPCIAVHAGIGNNRYHFAISAEQGRVARAETIAAIAAAFEIKEEGKR